MEQVRVSVDTNRVQALRDLLARLRAETLARVRDLRAEQDADALPPPSDELDVARSLAEVETHAALIERAEYRWKAIEEAFSRLERGRYGICEECGEEIPLKRLHIVPFAAYCVDCQARRNHEPRPGFGAIDEPARHLWKVPEGMEEPVEKEEALAAEEGRVAGRGKAFELEVEELEEVEELPAVATERRRGRPKKRATRSKS